MKKFVILTSAVLLTACAEFSDRVSVLQNPVFAASSRGGAMKSDVIAAGGQPRSTMSTLNGQGSCFNYLMNINGNSKPLYVGFNRKDQVVAWGNLTCEEAKQDGYLNATEPPKQKY
ncbi:hypothetical protein PQR63_07705 [Herbaspirillum rhizosphaerae]|uniref:Beta-barrel assembly machine subunit BamE n=1 Tax=Herbaspirillum rhizosphaerae TaxID=346179 RepID=A0ABW8Z5D7_9BURK